MKIVKFYVGIGFDQHGQPIPAQQAVSALTKMRTNLCKAFGGYTEIPAQGGWKDATVPIIEPSIVFECLADDTYKVKHESTVAAIAKEFAKEFNQKCVMVTQQPALVAFVTQ